MSSGIGVYAPVEEDFLTIARHAQAHTGPVRGAEVSQHADTRVQAAGKFFQCGDQKWYLKGLTYGPFAPGSEGVFLPELPQVRSDFAHIHSLGANAIRVYHVPPRWFLDEAANRGLRVFVDVPWEKHRCFFEEWSAQENARRTLQAAARDLGDHPALFAFSVANEIPTDIVRFYGGDRIARFIDELIDTVKQESPECLATFANFPPTEFLQPARSDFHCFNVYLEDMDKLGAYLDRLQHLAGSVPLVLGEHGMDSFRPGADEQARCLRGHVRRVFRHGLAGSFVFAYTDDWFTGGHQVEDWAFGITTRDRTEKPAARALKQVWARVPRVDESPLPRVSVVVCSYNGASTLEECLRSLTRLNYPDYEVILVDDGSQDHTAEIAVLFPEVRYIHQQNLGLSVSRNVGARAADGEIVAYTDSDCVADENWLTYLVEAMQIQQVEAIGGPNVPPPSDCWTAKCVAASPGGPSHVMLDDRRAEHIPGCNMAFRRDKLLKLGGFDPQFRQAGDDVDICWRFIDAGMTIGYAPAALIWHHRRNTIRAYLNQQKGYGRAEAMLHFKHPQRFNLLGTARWNGIIYGEGAVGLETLLPVVYHGQFGQGLFQTIYRSGDYSCWFYFTLLEWHAVAGFFLLLALLYPPLLPVSVVMWVMTLAAAIRSTWRAPLAANVPWWSRGVVFLMYLMQPLTRGWSRTLHRLEKKNLARSAGPGEDISHHIKRISWRKYDLYWKDSNNRGREQLLEAIVALARENGWPGDYAAAWACWDIRLIGDRWHNATIRTATEELGWPRRFTRARITLHTSRLAQVLLGATTIWTAAAAISGVQWAMLTGAATLGICLANLELSRRRCLRAVSHLLHRAAGKVGLTPVATRETSPETSGLLVDQEELAQACGK